VEDLALALGPHGLASSARPAPPTIGHAARYRYLEQLAEQGRSLPSNHRARCPFFTIIHQMAKYRY
jgi:hypothetical protein